MKTNVYYFDGVLHISIIKLENDILEPLKSVKNTYSRLTPNHKIIDLIKKDNEDNIQILIIINRKQKSALKLVEKYLLRDDVDLKFIKKNNIILHKDIDYAKMDINSIYDYHISNLESIKEINDKIKLFLVNPFNLEIKQINDDNPKKVILSKKYDDSSDSSTSDEYFPKNNVTSYKTQYMPYPIQNSVINKIPIIYNNRNANLDTNIGYDFDGVLHVSVTKPSSNGQIHALPYLFNSPYKLQPNYQIIQQITKQYNLGHKIYIVTHRQSQNSYNTICKFLGRSDVNLSNVISCRNIHLVSGNKGDILNKLNIYTFYDDSVNVLNDIKRKYYNINLYQVNPYNLSITSYNNNKSTINNKKIPVNRNIFANAAIILFCGRNLDRIVMVRDRFTRTWMIPGGNIEVKDKSPFFAAAREFQEETSFRLPKLGNNVSKYKSLGHTIIYKGFTKHKFGNFRPTKETDKILFPKMKSVMDGSFERKYGSIKSYVKNSLLKMFKDKFIP